MGNERYTSPETSRLLAGAGLSQEAPEGAWWCEAGCSIAPHVVVSRRASGEGPRALDLTDVLHELTRPRPEEKDARPLCVQVRLWHRATGGGWSSWCEAWDENGESVLTDDFSGVHAEWSSIEAAAAVLLALLKERK